MSTLNLSFKIVNCFCAFNACNFWYILYVLYLNESWKITFEKITSLLKIYVRFILPIQCRNFILSKSWYGSTKFWKKATFNSGSVAQSMEQFCKSLVYTNAIFNQRHETRQCWRTSNILEIHLMLLYVLSIFVSKLWARRK